jgi:hypothetical protein
MRRGSACVLAALPSNGRLATGIAGCTSACDLIKAGTAEYVPCGQV